MTLAPAPRPSRILVPVDFSAPSVHAVEQAARLAGEGGALVLLHAVVPPLGVAPGGLGAAPAASAPDEEEARRRLDDLAREVEASGVAVTTRLVSGDPATAALAAAEEGADLIVVGTHGMGGVKRLFLGSVAHAVAKGAETPVLLVR